MTDTNRSSQAERRSDSDLVLLGGLWHHTSSSGTEYLSGTLGAAKLLIFPNTNKQSGRSPDYRVFITRQQPPAGDDGNAAPAVPSSDDIPF